MAAARFLSDYIDSRTGLPKPSYDLWEERRGVLAFTVGAVYGGLVAAANLVSAFGEEAAAKRYSAAAATIKAAVEKYLYDEELGRFVRMVRVHDDGTVERDLVIDASMYGLWYFGMFSVDDPRIVRTMDAIKEALWCNTPIGGLARYENDYYQRVYGPEGSPPTTGNPWFVCTMWYAQYLISTASNPDELDNVLPLLQWAAERCLPSGVMAEQIDPYTGAPVSVSPLTWSHAAYVSTILEYLDRYAEMNLCPECGSPMHFREMKTMRETRHKAHWRHMHVKMES
jgi:GH15 family glucan-1,4-alpha-glucosidase